MTRETIMLQEAHRRMAAQGVSHQRHYAFRCPMCGTVQSMASLVKAGASKEKVHNFIAFSCEGRFSDAGPWPKDSNKTPAAQERRSVRGCDWTLGGLFSLHTLEIRYEDGKTRPSFEIVGPAEAKALESAMMDTEIKEPA